MFVLRLLLAAVATLAAPSDSRALDMNWALDKNEKLAYVNLWGKIEPGDDAKFRAVVTPLVKSGYLIFKINLFTGGGSVPAAKGIADQIKLLQARTVAPTRFSDIINNRRVERRYPSCWFDKQAGDGVVPNPIEGHSWCTCASACFFMWASGIVREGNHVGVHRIYYLDEAGRRFGRLSGPEAREQYLKDQRRVQGYLDTLDVPRTISDRMWATESENMHYLSKPELALMKSTPYLEEQTKARCGPDRTEHMSAANNWTATQDLQHVNCYRGLLKEFMREGARKYLASLGEAPAVILEPPAYAPSTTTTTTTTTETTTTQTNDDVWDHNGSSLTLVREGRSRKFVFKLPREGLREVGVTEGMTAFQGVRTGNYFEGTAYVFSRVCGAIGYAVKGRASLDDRTVTMRGSAPYVDGQCKAVGHRDGVLVFSLLTQGNTGPTIGRLQNTAFRWSGQQSYASDSFEDCENRCKSDSACRGFTYFKDKRLCRLMEALTERRVDRSADSGVKR
jgi:hypothetical protein